VVVIAKKDLELCLQRNPFLKAKDLDTEKLYVSFVSKVLSSDSIHELKISNIKPYEVAIDENSNAEKGTRILNSNFIEEFLG
jgi:uncharacterized protein (DUF1697 family)